MLRFGILGFGHHALHRLVPAFAGCSACSLEGIWRRNPEKAKRDALDLKNTAVYATATDLCASPLIDAIFVTSPDSLHAEHVLLAIQHGKAVLCEKPLGMNAAEVETMVRASQGAHVVFGVAQNFRYNASVQLARQWIGEGRIGKPRLAHVQFCYDAERSPREWIYDRSLACGGPIADVGIHCIDAMRFLLEDEPVAVSTIARKDRLSGEVESSAIVALELASGALGMASVTTRAAYRSLFEVQGEGGTILCENGLTVDRPVKLLLLRDGQIAASEELSNADCYSLMLDSFSKAVAGGSAYLATGADGLVNQRVLDAAYASWRTGTRQTILCP